MKNNAILGDPIIIWLDDVRNPSQHPWKDKINNKYGKNTQVIWVTNYFDFKAVLLKYFDFIDHICFDHDIASFQGNIEFTGYDAAKFLIDYCCDNNKTLPGFSCHSDNGPGHDNIIGILNNFKRFQENERS